MTDSNRSVIEWAKAVCRRGAREAHKFTIRDLGRADSIALGKSQQRVADDEAKVWGQQWGENNVKEIVATKAAVINAREAALKVIDDYLCAMGHVVLQE